MEKEFSEILTHWTLQSTNYVTLPTKIHNKHYHIPLYQMKLTLMICITHPSRLLQRAIPPEDLHMY